MTTAARKPQIQVILGSTRQGRSGEQVAKWFTGLAAQRSDIDIELVDLRDFPLPFFDSPTSPKRELSGDPSVQAWAAKVGAADGFIIVTPEYNYGYPAVLKNALDHLYYEWNDKPVGFVGYGGMAGGIRAVQQLRQVVVELGLLQTHAQVLIPRVFSAFDDDGQPLDAIHEGTASTLLDEVSDWARLLQVKRSSKSDAQLLAVAGAR